MITKGAGLPLVLVLAGVLGGLMTFGLIGTFVGPAVLAVAHTLLEAWAKEADEGVRRAGLHEPERPFKVLKVMERFDPDES